MKRLSCIVGHGWIALLALAMAAGGLPPAAAAVKLDPREIMRVSEIRPGMRGYGLTVFRGVKVERFDVKVLGVLPKENMGRSLILVRMEGGPISKRAANIIGGMSGSPVYIGGRLVGAVAYGSIFPREPIAMLTPVEDMLEALDPALPGKPAWKPPRRASAEGLLAPPSAPGERALDPPVRVGDRVYARVAFRSGLFDTATAGLSRPGTLEMAPLGATAMVSGVSPRGLERLGEMLRPFGVEAMSGPGAMKYDKPIPLLPGSAVGASLAVGDVDMTAVGTLTYRKGNQILAFGHPFLRMGPVDMPLTTAWVHDVFPSVMRSFKIASPVKMVGSVRQDRPWGIGGIVGRLPDLIPVEVSTRDFASGRRKTMRAKVIDNPFITPLLVAMVTDEAIARVHGVPGDATARVRTRIVTDKLGAIERENMFYDASGIDMAALGDLLQGLGILADNPWERVDVRGVRVTVDIDCARRTATVERVSVDREKYEPGDTVKVQVTVRPWGKETVKRALSIAIPEYAPNGRVTLRVHGGAGMGVMLAPQEGAGSEGPPVRMGPSPLPPSTSLKQLVNHYLEKERNNELVARLSLPMMMANISGQKMHTLPPGVLEVMRNPSNSGSRLQNDEVKVTEATPWVVSGMATVTLTIERHSYAEQGGAPSRPPAPPQPPSPAPYPRPAVEDDVIGEDDFISMPALRVRMASDGGSPAPPAPKAPAAGVAGPASPAGAPATSGAEASVGAPPKKPDADGAPPKAAGRSPAVWRQNTAEAFDRGRANGVAISTSSRGAITLGLAVERIRSLDAAYMWSLLARNGALYAGTGDKGIVYRLEGDSTQPVLKSAELQVLALAADAAGNVYASTSPRGRVYRITPAGESSPFWKSPEEYILSLCVDRQGNVYAGTAPLGRVYRIEPDGRGSLLARVPDPYVTSLALAGEDVIAGTGAGAAVFRITPKGNVTTFFDPAEGNTSSVVAADNSGNIYVGTAPRGAVYRVDAAGRAQVLQEKSGAGIGALAVDSRGVVWAAAKDAVYRIADAAGTPVVEKIEHPDGPRFVALALDEQGNVSLGSAAGEVYRLASPKERRGEFESTVRDAGSVARWGRLTWNAETPPGTRVALQTRTGNSEEPDATWSPWSAEVAESGQNVASPPGRFFQYRAILTAEKEGIRPKLLEVAVVYLARNQKPKLSIAAPKSGDVWAKKQTIRWNGSDPDKDALLYDVFASRDGGATWTKLNRIVREKDAGAEGAPPAESGSRPEEGGSGASPAPPAPGDGPGAPSNAGEKGHPVAMAMSPRAANGSAPAAAAPAPASAPPATPPDGAAAARPPEPPKRRTEALRDGSFAWDTTGVPDGSYLIKIVASDRLGNPEDPASVEQVVGPIVVCNTPPAVTLDGEPAAGADRSVRASGLARGGAPLAGVDYRVDEGEWASAAAENGIFEEESERFEVRTAPLDAGEHTLEIRVVDAAGNHVEEKRKVIVR